MSLTPASAFQADRRGRDEPARRATIQVPAPIEVEVDLYGPYSVNLATLVPGVSRRAGARTVTFTASDFEAGSSFSSDASIKPS